VGCCSRSNYQAERRQLAQARREAFVEPPTHRNQVWQLDFSEFETLGGGTWRIAGCADYFAKHEFGWRISPTENHHDAIAAVEQAIDEVEPCSATACCATSPTSTGSCIR
jgi:putative transposase